MKKRILVVSLVIALLAVCFAGTYAYLMDTKSVKNTFTTGNVYITLDEAVVEKDESGNLVAKGTERTEENQSYHLYPAMTVTKDPTITVEGTEAAYVAAVITVTFAEDTDIEVLREMGLCMEHWYDMLDCEAILDGDYIGEVPAKPEHPLSGVNNMQVYGNEKYSVYQTIDGLTYTIYMFFEGAQAVGTEITPFDTITIPASWDNEEMAAVNGMTIEVQAYATQTNGFADCYTAMTTAFKDAFKFN